MPESLLCYSRYKNIDVLSNEFHLFSKNHLHSKQQCSNIAEKGNSNIIFHGGKVYEYNKKNKDTKM